MEIAFITLALILTHFISVQSNSDKNKSKDRLLE